MIRSFRLPRFAALVLGPALAPLMGCGSSTGPTPVPCSQSVVFTAHGPIPAGTKNLETFTTHATGSLHVTVDWGSTSNEMSLLLTQAPCTLEQIQNSQCNVLFTVFSPPKPLHDVTTLLHPGTYELVVGNPNAVEESVSVEVVLKSAGCPAESQARLLEPPAPATAGRSQRPYTG